MDFEIFWKLVENHGHVAAFHREECACQWKNFSPDEQQAICDAIERKLRNGRFVHFNPAVAMNDNVPRKPQIKVMSADEYYRIHHTQANEDGWRRVFLPEQQKTIYVKQ